MKKSFILTVYLFLTNFVLSAQNSLDGGNKDSEGGNKDSEGGELFGLDTTTLIIVLVVVVALIVGYVMWKRSSKKA